MWHDSSLALGPRRKGRMFWLGPRVDSSQFSRKRIDQSSGPETMETEEETLNVPSLICLRQSIPASRFRDSFSQEISICLVIAEWKSPKGRSVTITGFCKSKWTQPRSNPSIKHQQPVKLSIKGFFYGHRLETRFSRGRNVVKIVTMRESVGVPFPC